MKKVYLLKNIDEDDADYEDNPIFSIFRPTKQDIEKSIKKIKKKYFLE